MVLGVKDTLSAHRKVPYSNYFRIFFGNDKFATSCLSSFSYQTLTHSISPTMIKDWYSHGSGSSSSFFFFIYIFIHFDIKIIVKCQCEMNMNYLWYDLIRKRNLRFWINMIQKVVVFLTKPPNSPTRKWKKIKTYGNGCVCVSVRRKIFKWNWILVLMNNKVDHKDWWSPIEYLRW